MATAPVAIREGPSPQPAAWQVGFGTSLALAMAFGTTAQYTLGVLNPFVRDAFDLSRAAVGFLTTIMFVVAMGSSLLVGRLVDSLSSRTLVFGLHLAVAATVGFMAIAPTYLWLVVAAGVAGIPVAMANPLTNKLVADLAEPRLQGLLLGVKQSGVQFGAFGAGALLPPLAEAHGWRTAMALTALACACVVLVTAWVVPSAPVEGSSRPRTREAFQLRTVRWLAAYAFFMGGAIAVLGAYVPLYAVEALDTGTSIGGLVAGTMALVGTVARLVWGASAARFTTVQPVLFALAATSGLATAAFLAAPWFGVGWLWVGAIAMGCTVLAWSPMVMLAIVRAVPPTMVGSASAAVGITFYGGFVVSPVAFGALADWTGTYGPAWVGFGVSMMAAAALALAWKREGLVSL